MAGFVNRAGQLAALEQWWKDGGSLAALWGRRRVGKTALAHHFAEDKPVVFHRGAGRGDHGELAQLTRQVARSQVPARPEAALDSYGTWAEALADLEQRAGDRTLLLVLDNASTLLASRQLTAALRDRASGPANGRLKVLLCSSSIRQMEALTRPESPLHDVVDLTLTVEPFSPREAAELLAPLPPADRARVYGLVGGIPLYLSWWDTSASIEQNVDELVCRPGAPLLAEGDLLLGVDLEDVGFNDRVLHGLAQGHTSYNEIRAWAGTEPARPLDRLIELRLIERVQPIGESPQARRRRYRIVDPFVRFYLAGVCGHRCELDRGMADGVAARLVAEAETRMPELWLDVFRRHLHDRALAGELPVAVAAGGVGSWWDNTGNSEIDALGLGVSGVPVLAGTAAWEPTVDAGAALAELKCKVARGLGAYPDRMVFVACARDQVREPPLGTVALTASDLFGP